MARREGILYGSVMSQRAVEEVEYATNFYASIDLDVSHFSALWHTYTVGHLLFTDLDRIAREHDISVADLHLLGALRIDRPRLLRATDLAATLQVSNAVLSGRIARLGQEGLLIREPSASDRRAFELRLTAEGAKKVEDVMSAIEQRSGFVRHYHSLPQEDQATIGRIMGDLHSKMDRDFIAVKRGKL